MLTKRKVRFPYNPIHVFTLFMLTICEKKNEIVACIMSNIIVCDYNGNLMENAPNEESRLDWKVLKYQSTSRLVHATLQVLTLICFFCFCFCFFFYPFVTLAARGFFSLLFAVKIER